jgi:hypothetical protein
MSTILVKIKLYRSKETASWTIHPALVHLSVNKQGGSYERGKAYSFTKKWAVVVILLWWANWPTKPTNLWTLGKEAGVFMHYTRRVMEELTMIGWDVYKTRVSQNQKKMSPTALALILLLKRECFFLPS